MKKGPYHYVDPTGYPGHQRKQQADFDQFEATELYCANCGRAVPVRKSLLLVLPSGDKYEYTCQYCGSKVGDKVDRSGSFSGILKT
ncbi:MAG: cytoplasmic protein [Deltaproteobacteria bacterium]|nr:cytoplasmic protein [Deltaproteobacteria bacterium]